MDAEPARHLAVQRWDIISIAVLLAEPLQDQLELGLDELFAMSDRGHGIGFDVTAELAVLRRAGHADDPLPQRRCDRVAGAPR